MSSTREHREQSRCIVSSDLGGLEILDARFSSHRFVPHFHETYAVGVVLEGAQDNGVDGRGSHVAVRGQVLVINPGEVHGGRVLGDQACAYVMFYPSVGSVAEIAEEVAQDRGRVPSALARRVIDDPVVSTALMDVYHSLCNSDSTVLERQSVWTWSLTALVLRHGAGPAAAEPRIPAARAVEVAREYLHAHVSTPVDLSDLARAAGVSRYHLCRSFSKAMGVPPHAYQIQLRLERAKRLLREGRPIAEVAISAGFADQSHLTRRFRAVLGTTPARYARAGGR